MAVELVYETHSISVDNERGIATGWLPGELSAEGRRLAYALGERRRNDGIDCVFTSDLRRAVETAEIAFEGSPIGSGCSEAVAQPQLLDCLGGGVGRHLDASADNAPPEEVAPEVDAALEALGKQARDGGLSGSHRTGDEISRARAGTRLHLVSHPIVVRLESARAH
jgi:broad specificity phosphatase PhoE